LAEFVVGGLQAVNADAHVVVANRGNLVDGFLGDQGAVGGQADVEARFIRPAGNVEDVRAQQVLTAGENQHRYAVGLEIVHHGVDFLGAQLALEVDVGRDRVAVFAGQVTAADEVPDYHRAAGFGHRAHWRRVHQAFDVTGHSKHKFSLSSGVA